ncbi:MAG: hypothetical protein U0835_17255 [Isosphaeraceae bacterium]
MAKRILLASVLGGLAYFFWGAVAHVATPLGTMGLSRLTPEREEAALSAMREAAPESGMYFFPGMDMKGNPSESEVKAWEERLHRGPSGLLIYTSSGAEAMSPRQLGTEFGIDVLVALLASILLSCTRLSYPGRVGYVALLGLFAFASISLSYWNWYHFTPDFTLAVLIEEAVGGLVLGAVVGAIVKPTVPAEPSTV